MEDGSKLTNGTDDLDRTLPSPHFDDEATLLSARPVVPFHELAGRNPRRRLYFGAGLVVALLIGLLGGIFYARMQEGPQLRSETSQPSETLPIKTAAPEELVSSTDEFVESPEETSVSDPNTTATADKVAPKTTSARRPPARIAEKPLSRPARRRRLETPREAHKSDDIFRIQEIFEGSSRP